MRLNEFIIEADSTFCGACDRLRREPGGEEKWQEMMGSRREISEREFLANVDIKAVLDFDETWEDYRYGAGDDIVFFESDNEYFFQWAGFEFIWNKRNG